MLTAVVTLATSPMGRSAVQVCGILGPYVHAVFFCDYARGGRRVSRVYGLIFGARHGESCMNTCSVVAIECIIRLLL